MNLNDLMNHGWKQIDEFYKEFQMTTPKYKITEAHLDTPGAAAKLERDGHDRHTIHDAMYKLTEGATQRDRERIMSKLYDREKPC